MNNIWILAQAQTAPGGITSENVTDEQATTTVVVQDTNAPGAPVTVRRSPLAQFLPIILIFIVFYLLLFRGPRKKQQEHKKMVQTLQKNDRVRTIGGIIGTVVDIKDDEVTLKVDELNNTKIKVTPSAIGKNLSKDK